MVCSRLMHFLIFLLLLLLAGRLGLVEEVPGLAALLVVEELAWLLLLLLTFACLQEFLEALRDAAPSRAQERVCLLVVQGLGAVALDTCHRGVAVRDELEHLILRVARLSAQFAHGLVLSDNPGMVENCADIKAVLRLAHEELQN